MTDESRAPQSPEEVVDGLLEGSFDGIDEGILDAIRGLGAGAVAPLLTMAQNEDLGGAEARGGGSAPVRAMELLVEMRAEEAMLPLLDLLPTLPELSIMRDRVADRLPRYGRALLEPLLERTMQAEDKDDRVDYLFMLSELGVQDDRIYDLLLARMEEDPVHGLLLFQQYEDPRVIDELLGLAGALQPGQGRYVREVAAELPSALERQGYELPEDLRRHLDSCRAPSVRTVKVGRNDPCPCGSGKKYKKCCMKDTE